MKQPCPHCGYSSDRQMRFCRQCGAFLSSESEASSAETQNYSSQQGPEPPDQHPSTPESEPSIGSDEKIPQPARFYRPPAAGNYVMRPQKTSNAGVWILVALVGFMLVGGSIVSWMISEFRPGDVHTATQKELAQELEDQFKNRIHDMVRDSQRAREEKDRSARAADSPYKRIEASEHTNVFPTALEKYKYPNARVDQITSVTGNDFIRMTTDDQTQYVSDFYKKIVGQPVVENKEVKGEKAIFQISGSPQIVIVVGPHSDDPDKTLIQILSSSIPQS